MRDEKTKEQIFLELEEMRERIVELEKSEKQRKKIEKALKECNERYKERGPVINRYSEEMEIIANAAITLVGLKSVDEIYNFITEKIEKLTENSYVIISSYNQKSELMGTRHILGVNADYMTKITDILGQDIFKMEYTLEEITSEQFEPYTRRKLVKIPGGLYLLTAGRMPKVVVRAIEKIMGIGDIYGMGFSWEGKQYGGATFLVKKGYKLKHKKLIETLMNLTGIALQRKFSQEKLKDSERRYRTIFENTGTATVIIETDYILSLVNTEFEKLSGYLKEELEGKKSWTDFVVPEDMERMKNYHKLRRENPGKAPGNYEFRLIDGNKNIKNVLATVAVFPETKKSLASLLDITQRKKNEEEIKDQYHFLQRLTDTIPYPLFYKDINYAYIGCNKSFEEFIGLSKDEIIGKTVYDIAPQDLADKYQMMDQELIEEGPLQVYEAPVRYADGSNHIVIFNKSTFNDSEGKLAGIIGVMVDITQRREAEEQLKKSVKEKETLLKEIHHRVKNNLMVISSLLNLQSSFIKDKEALDIFRESQSRAKSMALIHERLYQSTDLKRINFGDYIRTLTTDLYHTYGDPGRVNLKMDVDDLMLDINTTVPLGLTVNELVSNCMKHAFPGDNTGEVNISFHKIDGEYVLNVFDTGVGFPEYIDFRNTESLGLQLVNTLVSQIDGIIEMDSNHGTAFTIKFKELEL